MQAVLVEAFDTIDKISMAEVPRPAIHPGHVRVKVQAASLGFVDGLKVRGLYQTKDPLPFIPGMEFSGIIDDLADDVTGYAIGDFVMGFAGTGALAEYVVAPEQNIQIAPTGVSPEVAASYRANFLTALYGLEARAKLTAGEQLLVLGAAGGVGTAAIQIGKLMGARVIAAASTEKKRDYALSCGADAALDYTQSDWRTALNDATSGTGPDVIYDPVGGAVSEQAFRSIAWNGRHIVVGFAAGEIPTLKFNLPLLKGGYLLGVDVAQLEEREPEVHQHLMARLRTWLESQELQPIIGAVFDFPNYRNAFLSMENREALGKVVVRIS